MDSLLASVQQRIGDAEIQQISHQLGADEDRVRTAVAGALPLLLSALADNAREPQQAAALAGALDRDHDGSLLDQLGGFLSQGNAQPGLDILGHVLGGRQRDAERGLGRASGLDPAMAGKVMAMLAPIVMAYLGRRKRQEPMSPGDLGAALGRERIEADKQAGGRDILSSMLDRDGDGQVMDDLGKMLLSSFLGGRR